MQQPKQKLKLLNTELPPLDEKTLAQLKEGSRPYSLAVKMGEFRTSRGFERKKFKRLRIFFFWIWINVVEWLKK